MEWLARALKTIEPYAKSIDDPSLIEALATDCAELIGAASHCTAALSRRGQQLRPWLASAAARPPRQGFAVTPLDDRAFLLGARDLFHVSVAAALVSRDAADWERLSRGVRALAEHGRWLRRIHQLAREQLHRAPTLELHALVRAYREAGTRHGVAADSVPPLPLPPCFQRALDAVHELQIWAVANRPARPLTNADGIEQIDPSGACAYEQVVVRGHGFGEPPLVPLVVAPGSNPFSPNPRQPTATTNVEHPPDRQLLFPIANGCEIATVIDWHDRAITVEVLPEARRGCVGFRDLVALADWTAYVAELNQRVQQIAIGYEHCTGQLIGLPVFEVPHECPPCTGTNLFEGTIPELAVDVDGTAEVVCEPGDTVTIHWTATRTTGVKVYYEQGFASGSQNVAVLYPDTADADANGYGLETAGSATFTAPGHDDDYTIHIEANGPCGTVTQDVTVHVRKTTTVSIVGVEVTQAIQTLVFDHPEESNTVPLVAGKRAHIRVYVDSGLPTDYGNGGRLQHVDVTARLTQLAGLPSQTGWLQPIVPYSPRPRANLDRTHAESSANIEMTLLTGTVRIDVQVNSSDPFARWAPTSTTLILAFVPSAPLNLVLKEVQLTNVDGPTDADVHNGVNVLTCMLPVASDGIVLTVSPNGSRLSTNHSSPLSDGEFLQILIELMLAADEVLEFDVTWIGVLNHDAEGEDLDGMGFIGIPAIGVPPYMTPPIPPTATWIAHKGATPTHEIMHTFGFEHVTSTIGEVGYDFRASPPAPVPPSTPDIMTPTGDAIWIGVDFYEAAFLAILGELP